MTETQTPLTFLRVSWLLLSAVGYLYLAYAVPRTQFGLLMSLLTGLFLGYILVLRSLSDSSAPADRFLFASAIGFRLLLLFALPQLSDDVYRFVWDGRLLAHGYNPYLYQPNQLLNTPIAATCGLDESLLRLLNSPSYFTVYPPVNQALFGLAAWLSPESLLGNVIWLRIPIVVCEAGSLWLMVKLLRWLNMHPNLALLYGLNPLVILELTGNVHAESIMIFFVLLAAWLLVAYDRWIASAGALALAIGTKLLPLLLLPLIIRRLGWRKGLGYAWLAGALTMALFAPFASLDLARNVFSSLNLYFQKFEFNASVYYVLRAIGYWVKGYNAIERIGFWLSVTTTLSVLWIAFCWRTATSVQLIATLTVYFAFATTVHPWYVTTLVAASAFTRFRYPIVWSALIPLSYFTYHTQPYQEYLWLTGAEYVVVLGAALYQRNPSNGSKSLGF
jgi:hypothetical protein